MLPKLRTVFPLLACLALPSVAQATVITNNVVVTNNTASTQTFSASFGVPLPVDLYSFASAELTVTVTPGQSGTGAVDLAPGDSFLLVGTALDGVTEVDLGVGRGTTACVAVRVPETCTFPLITNTFVPTAFAFGFAKLRFTVTADTTAALMSLVTIEPARVPEPSSLLLLATAAAGAWRARRRF